MKQIDYRRYTDDELLDVERHINQVAFPERYKQLQDEIKRRQALGIFNVPPELPPKELNNTYWRNNEIIFEFTSISKSWRITFVATYLLVNIAVLAWIIPNYYVSPFHSLHLYTTTIDDVDCRKDSVENEKTGEISDYYDIVISAYPNTFIAPNIHYSKCQHIASTLTTQADVSIWQQDGLIHQLKINQQMLLSYDYMKSKIREFRTRGLTVYFFILFALGVLSFKSLYNAFYPGTFKQAYRQFFE